MKIYTVVTFSWRQNADFTQTRNENFSSHLNTGKNFQSISWCHADFTYKKRKSFATLGHIEKISKLIVMSCWICSKKKKKKKKRKKERKLFLNTMKNFSKWLWCQHDFAQKWKENDSSDLITMKNFPPLYRDVIRIIVLS